MDNEKINNEEIIEPVEPEDTAETASDDDEKPSGGASVLNDFLDIVESAVFSFFMVIIVFTFLFRVATVQGTSMLQTLQDNDRIFLNHVAFEPTNGDIVVISCKGGKYPPLMSNDYIIKRVIATEHQIIDIDFDKGIVYVDGVALEENYTNNLTINNDGANTYPLEVPEDCIFVMGDNRQHSTDSRAIGCVKEADVLGQAVFRYWPFDTLGTLE